MEYRIETITFGNEDNRLAYLEQRLNALAKDGWRVVSIDLAAHPAFKSGPLPVLLERASPAATRQNAA
jgi:hypothetical protein